MFILFGIDKQTVKKYGKTPEECCSHCRRSAPRYFIRVTSWFTLFFIPIFPYGVKYLLVCPLCSHARPVSREELDGVIRDLTPMDPESDRDIFWRPDEGGTRDGWPPQGDNEYAAAPDRPEPDRYAGKNSTQKAYLEKLEAFEKAAEARQTLADAGVPASSPDDAEGAGEKGLDARRRDLEIRERALEIREKALEIREKALEAKESAHG